MQLKRPDAPATGAAPASVLPPDPLGPNGHSAPAVRQRRTTVALVLAAVVCLLLLAYYGMFLMGATRAYVGGEAHWSKAQKEAVYRLARYAHRRDPADWRLFRQELGIYAAARQARLEMDRPRPDLATVRQHLVAARNHPADAAAMLHLYRHYRSAPPVSRAVGHWVAADGLMDEVERVGNRVHAAVAANAAPAALQDDLLALERINGAVAPHEAAFANELGNAARAVRQIFLAGLLALSVVLVAGAARFARRMAAQDVRARRILARSEQQLRSLIQVAPMPLAIVRTADNTFIYANDRALQQFKLRPSQIGSVPPRDMYYRPSDRDRFWSAMLLEGRLHGYELQLQDTEGRPFWALVSAERVVYAGEDCVLIATNDIDERRRAQDALRYRAFHDELTGLPNRAMFMDTLKRTMSRLDRKGSSCAVLFIDLDHFKEVNDTWGHAAGDLLLQQVAQRIRLSVREGDMVARLGGDEFVVLVEEAVSADDLRAIAQNLVDALARPCQLGPEVEVQVTSSIGISRYPQHGRDLDSLVKHADQAMYRAKQEGRNNFQFSELGTLQ